MTQLRPFIIETRNPQPQGDCCRLSLIVCDRANVTLRGHVGLPTEEELTSSSLFFGFWISSRASLHNRIASVYQGLKRSHIYV